MTLRSVRAPGSARRAGPGVFLGICVALGLASCKPPPGLQPPAELELEDRTILLERGVEVHEIRLRSPSTGDPVQPDSVPAKPGDVVRFVAADARTHAVAFDDAALRPDQREFLESTNQMRSPPLLATGSAWIVSFEDAPAGAYPFRSLTHDASGTIYVAGPE